MASAEFLEQALSTDVDQNAVNAVIGSLENQLVKSVSSQSSHSSVINVTQTHQSNQISLGVQKYTDHTRDSAILPSVNSGLLFNNVQHSSGEHLKVYSQAPTLSNASNRLTIPANGCLNLPQSQIITIPTSVLTQQSKTVAMQPPLVIKQGTSSAQVGLQSGMVTVPMTVSSSMPTSISNVMALNKPQNVVVTTQNIGSAQSAIIPNVQILNMRPGAPSLAAQKSVATVSPRVVIGSPQVVGARAAAPGITLQTLQSLQAGQQSHLLLKTENGQYQLLRVGPAPASTLAPQAQAIRLSTVPTHPGVATVSTSVAPIAGPIPQTQVAAPVAVASVANVPTPVQQPAMQPAMQPQTVAQPPMVTTQKPSDNTKEKCRNFLANLLDLSSKEPKSVERNVRNLIQELIDAKVEPEEFCDRLEKLLNASPQPCLIGFLKKSLPLLRQSLVTKELEIVGINPPSPNIAFAHGQAPMQPVLQSHPNLQIRPPPKSGTIAVLQNIPVQTKIKVSGGKAMTVGGKANFRPQGPSGGLQTVLTGSKSLLKDKDKKSMPFSSQPFVDDKMAGDDDINDVAAMGGVNLAEETQRILGSTEMIGTQIRSCKDESLVPLSVMQARVKAVCAKHGLEEPSPDVAMLLSHALHERMKNLIEKLAVIAQHRIDMIVKSDSRYEPMQDVKGQLKFLEELDRVDKKRREDSEREMLLRAAKSRSKNEDPEQAKLKAKAKEMQRAELEELRQREANLTALQAIGPRKKARLEGQGGSGDASPSGNSSSGLTGRSQLALRTRLKRINYRDMLYLLEQERDTAHSELLFRSYLK